MTTSITPPSARGDEPAESGEAATPRPPLRRALLIVGALVFALIVSLAQLAVVLMPLAWLAVAWALPSRLLLGRRLLIAAPLTLVWLIVATPALHVIGFGLQPFATWAPLLGIAVALRRPAIASDRPTKEDQLVSLVPWITAVVVVGFLLSSAFIAVGGNGEIGLDERLAVMATSEDGASHFSIMQAVMAGEGLAYVDAGRRVSAQWQYPPGFHLIGASLAKGLDGTVGTSPLRGGVPDALWTTLLAAFGLLAAATGTLAASIASSFGSRPWTAAVVSVITGLGLLFGYPFTLVTFFFGPQALALAALVALLCVVRWSGELGTRLTVGVVASTLVAISWTWFFLAPVAAGVALLWIIFNRSELRREWPLIVVAAAVAIGASVTPIYFSIRAADTSVINVVGGVTAIPAGVVYGPALGAIVLALAIGRTRKSGLGDPAVLIGTLAAATVFSYALGKYQEHTLGATAYFYGKSLYTVAVLGVPALLGLGAALLGKLQVSAPRAAVILVIGVLGAMSLTDTQVIDRSQNKTWLYRDTGGAGPLRYSFSRYVNSFDAVQGRFVLQWEESGAPITDYTASRWLTTLNGRATSEVWGLWYKTVTNQDRSELAKFINSTDGNVAILTAKTDLKEGLAAAGADREALDNVVLVP